MEQQFLNDQYSERKMAIDKELVVAISILRKKKARKSREPQKIVKFNQEKKKINKTSVSEAVSGDNDALKNSNVLYQKNQTNQVL